jgi:hypothetical protein
VHAFICESPILGPLHAQPSVATISAAGTPLGPMRTHKSPKPGEAAAGASLHGTRAPGEGEGEEEEGRGGRMLMLMTDGAPAGAGGRPAGALAAGAAPGEGAGSASSRLGGLAAAVGAEAGRTRGLRPGPLEATALPPGRSGSGAPCCGRIQAAALRGLPVPASLGPRPAIPSRLCTTTCTRATRRASSSVSPASQPQIRLELPLSGAPTRSLLCALTTHTHTTPHHTLRREGPLGEADWPHLQPGARRPCDEADGPGRGAAGRG